MLRTLLIGALLVSADATAVTEPSVALQTLVINIAPKFLTIGFKTSAQGATALATGGTITVTADKDVFSTATAAPTPITVTAGAATCDATIAVGSTKQIVLTLADRGTPCSISVGNSVQVTVGANTNTNSNGFANNPAPAGTNVGINIKTSVDTTDAPTTYTTVAEAKVTVNPNTGVVPSTYIVSKPLTSLAFKFSPSTFLPNPGTVTIKPTPNNAAAAAIFTATAAGAPAAITINPAGCASTAVITAGASGSVVITVPCNLNAGTEYTIGLTSNLASNPATAGDVSFDITTTTDTVIAQAKYPAVTLTVTPGSNVVGKAVEKLTFVFTPTATVPTTGSVTIKAANTAAQGVWGAQATAFAIVVAPVCATAVPTATTTTGANAAMTIKSSCELTARTQYTFTVSANLLNNPAAPGDVKFTIETSADPAVVEGLYQAVASVTAYTVTPSSVVASAKLSSLAFKFTPTTTVAASTANGVTIKTASSIWTAQATAFSITIAPACTNADVKATTAVAAGTTPAQMQITSSCELTGGTSYTLTVTSNLGSNPAAVGDVTLSLQTTADPTPVDAKYAVVNPSPSPTSVSPGSNTSPIPNPQSPSSSASPALTPSVVLLLIAFVPFLRL